MSIFQPKKEKKTEERRIEPRYVEDDSTYKDHYETTKRRLDETRTSQRQLTTEKFTVTRTDGTRTEEIQRPTHPKDHDVGRIVINKIPEEKEEEPQVYRRYEGKPKTTEVTVTRADVKDVFKTNQKKDVINVGRLDLHGLEKTPEESRKMEERLPTEIERVQYPRQVCSDNLLNLQKEQLVHK